MATPAHAATVTFTDPSLEAVVRLQLLIPAPIPVTDTDMLLLASLSADGMGITDLGGLEYAANLSTLHLNNNEISDISPLVGLMNLNYLRITGNPVSDVSPLAGLTNLTVLRLGASPISDISPLAGLTNLTQLRLGDTQVSDISPLASLTNLTELYLPNDRVSDLAPLVGLTNLQYLYLNNNQISDVSPLVSNAGIGSGDNVRIQDNSLDLTPGSQDMLDILTLVDRGVSLSYSPQNPVNHPPVATAGSASTNQNTSVQVTLLGSDIDSDPLVYSVVSGPSHGSLGAVSGDKVAYTPTGGYSGADSFTFKVNDGTGDSDPAIMSITVNALLPPDNPPVVSTPASSVWSLALAGFLAVGALLVLRRREELA
jgi:hypothetical protein